MSNSENIQTTSATTEKPIDGDKVERFIARCRDDEKFFIESCVSIRDRDTNSIIPFKFNAVQNIYEKEKSQFDIILKSRKLGMSTRKIAGDIWACAFKKNQYAILINQDKPATLKMLEDRVKPILRSIKFPIKYIERRDMIIFPDTNSKYYVGTAGTKAFGRGSDVTRFHLCLHPDSLVIVKDGYLKKIKEIRKYDSIITHLGNSTNVECLSVTPTKLSTGDSKIVKVFISGNSDFPIRATKEHLIFARVGKRDWKTNFSLDQPRWLRADILQKKTYRKYGHFIGTPIRKITNEITGFDMPIITRSHPGVLPVMRRLEANYGLGWIFGLYLSEGVVLYNINRKTRDKMASGIVFCLHQKETNFIRLLKIYLNGLGNIKVHNRINSKSMFASFYNTSFARLVEGILGKCADKRIPDDFLNCGRDFLRGLVRGYLDGDGHLSKSRNDIYVSSICPQILTQLRDIIVALGYGYSSIYRRDKGYHYGRNCREIWTMCISGICSENLKNDLGYPLRLISRKQSSHWYMDSTHVWSPVVGVEYEEQPEFVYDVVLNHPDHSYRLIAGSVHNSEVSFWPTQDLITSIEEACVGNASGSIETTANGTNFFMRLWKAAVQGNSRYKPIFIPWWQDPRHRITGLKITDITEEEKKLIEAFNLDLEQISWRRQTIKGMSQPELFAQEHPATCVSGDTRICTDSGIIKIKDSANLKTVDRNLVSRFIPQGIRKTFEIKTKNFRKVRVTSDHLLALNDGRFVQTKDIKIGDRIKLSRTVFSNKYCEISYDILPSVRASIPINEDWGKFLGYFMGDGCYHDFTLDFHMDKKDVDVCSDIRNIVNKLFGLNVNERIIHGGRNLRVGCTKLLEVFSALGIVRMRTSKITGEIYKGHIRDVRVPECIFRSPESVVREFLSALFECDGCAYKYTPRVMFFTKHEQFARDVNMLLYGFGVNSKITKATKKAGNGSLYIGFELSLSARNATLFHDKIGFISQRKRDGKRWCGYKSGRPPCDIDDFDIVEFISEYGDEDVYDLTVPELNVFGANGLLVHNCVEAFVSSGRLVFDWVAMVNYDRLAENSLWTGFLRWNGDATEFQPQDRGNLYIWEHPNSKHQYVIGADVAEGLTDGAYSAAFVLDVNTSTQVAEWHGRVPPDRFADVLANLGYYYNTGLLVPESWPGCGNITTLRLLDVGYKNIWKRPARSNRNNPEQLWGWETTGRTRPLMLHELASAIRDYKISIKSRGLLDELKSIIYDDGGDMTSQLGCYSDRVMACAMAWYVSREIAVGLPPEKPSLRAIERASRQNGFATSPSWTGPKYGVRQ